MTEDWRDTLLRQEQDEIDKLAVFIEREKVRTHLAAAKQKAKELKAHNKFGKVLRMKQEMKEETKMKNQYLRQ